MAKKETTAWAHAFCPSLFSPNGGDYALSVIKEQNVVIADGVPGGSNILLFGDALRAENGFF